MSFTGDLGWELHCDAADQSTLYAALLESGQRVDAGPVGSRALMSLRLEKAMGRGCVNTVQNVDLMRLVWTGFVNSRHRF